MGNGFGSVRSEQEDVLGAEWERHRPAVFGAAYRLLGSVADAEDVTQDVWLRAAGADLQDIGDLRAWLVTVAARRSYDILKSARFRRETYVGPWLPEPLLTGPDASQPVLDLQAEKLQDAGEADIVFDVIGGDILGRSAALVRAGGTLVTITMPPKVRPKHGRAVFFVVEPDRARLATRLRDGRLRPVVGAVRPLTEAPAAFAPGKRTPRQNDHPHHGRPRGPIVIGKRISLRTSLDEFVRLWLDPTSRAGKDRIQGGAG